MRFSILTGLLLVSTYTAQAQYTEVINSNRPGASQSAFAVGNQIIQLEVGAGPGWEKHNLLETESDMFFVDYAFRFGIGVEQLEINFIGSHVTENGLNTQTAIPYEYRIKNFRSNTVGLKYLLYDPYRKRDLEKPNIYSWHANNSFRWRELIPAVALFAGANINNEENPYIPPGDKSFSPKVALIIQNNMEGGWVFVTNWIFDRIEEDYPTFTYILTLTHAITPRFSIYAENQGIQSDFYADQLLRGGAAYLLSRNFQIDIQGSMNFKDTPSKYFVGLGVSVRMDMHEKDFLLNDDGTKYQEGKEKDKKKTPEQVIEEFEEGN